MVVFLAAVVLFSGLLILRGHVDEWARSSLERRLSEGAGAAVHVGQTSIRLWRLEASFSDIRVELPAADAKPLVLAVGSGRARLAWRGLAAFAGRRVHLTRLELDRPTVVLDRSFLEARTPKTEEAPPLDLRIDRLVVSNGSFRFDDRSVDLEFEARDTRLRASWDLGALVGEAKFRAAVRQPPLVRSLPLEVSSGFRFYGHDLELTDLIATGPGIDLNLHCHVDLTEGLRIVGRGDLEADAATLYPWLDPQFPELSGLLRGPIGLEFGPDPIRIRASLQAEDPRFGTIVASRAQAQVRYSPGTLELGELTAEAFGGTVDGTVSVSVAAPTRFDADLVARDVEATSVFRWLGSEVPLSARLDGTVRIAGTANASQTWVGQGEFSARPPALTDPGLPAVGRGTLALDQGRIRVMSPALQSGSADLEVDLDLDLIGEPRSGTLKLAGVTNDARQTQQGTLRILESLELGIPDFLRHEISGAGPIEARIEFGGIPRVETHLDFGGASWGDREFDRATVDMKLRGSQLDIAHFELRRDEEIVAGSGSLVVEPFSVRRMVAVAEGADPRWLLGLAGIESDLTGVLRGNIEIRDAEQGVRGEGRLELIDGSWLGEPFDRLAGDVQVGPAGIEATGIELRGPGATARGTGLWDPETGKGAIEIETGRIELETVRIVREKNLELRGEIDLAGRLGFDGAGAVEGRLTLEGPEWWLGAQRLGAVRGDLELSADGVGVSLVGEEVGWQLTGQLGTDAALPVDASLNLVETPVDLRPYVSTDGQVRLTGTLHAQGILSDPANLDVSGTITAADIDWGLRHLRIAAPFQIRSEAGQWSPAPIRIIGTNSDVVSTLSLDMAGQEIDLSATGRVDLGVLTAPFDELRAEGPVELDVRLSGPLASPELQGTMSGAQARLRWLGFPQGLDQGSFKVEFDRQVATVRQARARFGNGEIRASGAVRLDGYRPSGFSAKIDAANVRVEYPEDMRATYEGQFRLEGDDRSSNLAGTVRMLRGSYEKDLDLAALLGTAQREYAGDEARLPDNLYLDVDLLADGNVWVRNDLAEVESRFALHVGGTLRRPEITGRLSCIEGGKLVFRDVDYRVNDATVDFVNREAVDPYLTLRAETTVKDYTVYLRVEGTADDFEYELTSDPTLSTQDIIALLTTGNTLEEITSQGGGAQFTGDLATNYFAGALTAPFERQLQRLLKFERVRITPQLIEGENDPTTQITLGKRVAEDVLVVFSTDLGQSERQVYQVEWQASRKFRLTAEQDTLGGLGGDLRYSDRFWWRKPDRSAGVVPEVSRGVVLGPELSRVGSIEFNGIGREESGGLGRRIDLRVGDTFSRTAMFEAVEQIRKRYVESRRIEAVVDAKAVSLQSGTRVTFAIEPGPLTMVEIVGTTDKERRKIRVLLERFWVESGFSEDLYDDSALRIRDFYHGRGYFAVDVAHEVRTAEGVRQIRFEVDRGKLVRVREVLLHGVERVNEERIRRQMLTRTSSLFVRRELIPDVLDQDVDAIRSLYRDAGFLRVNILEPVIRMSTEADSAVVELTVEEGRRFHVSSLKFSGDLPGGDERLQEWSRLALDQVFSPARLLQAESLLRSELDLRGYPDARVRGRVELGDAGVQVTFEVNPGQMMRVDRILLRGNRLTREKIIKRELVFKEGDLISRELLLRSQHRLYQLGIFRNVTIQYYPAGGPDPTLYVVEVVVDEAAPFTTSLGAGYDTEAQTRLSFSLSNDNLEGYDRVLGFQGRVSSLERRLQIIGREPRLFGRRLPALVNLSWEDREEVGFSLERLGTALRVDRRFGSKWSAYARYAFQQVELSDVVNPEEVLQEKLDDVTLGSVGLALVRDTRDDPFLATRGSYLTFGTEIFAHPFLSESSFAKASANASTVVPLLGGTSSASSIRFGIALPFGSTNGVPISEGFFAGGDSTLRGFPRDEVGPPTGGEALFLINQELRFPIWSQLKGVVFYDAGNVYEEAEDIDLDDLRHVLGLGLRLETPIGPLRFGYGGKLDREPAESRGEFFLSIGSAF